MQGILGCFDRLTADRQQRQAQYRNRYLRSIPIQRDSSTSDSNNDSHRISLPTRAWNTSLSTDERGQRDMDNEFLLQVHKELKCYCPTHISQRSLVTQSKTKSLKYVRFEKRRLKFSSKQWVQTARKHIHNQHGAVVFSGLDTNGAR